MSLKKSTGNIKKKRDRSWESSENGKASARRWYKKSPNAMYSLYKKSAKRRELEFNISIDDFISLIKKPCTYCCSLPPEDSQRNGLDRIVNSIGYIESNLTPCCIKCNQMKGKLSVKDFINHIKKILNYQEEKSNAA